MFGLQELIYTLAVISVSIHSNKSVRSAKKRSANRVHWTMPSYVARCLVQRHRFFMYIRAHMRENSMRVHACRNILGRCDRDGESALRISDCARRCDREKKIIKRGTPRKCGSIDGSKWSETCLASSRNSRRKVRRLEVSLWWPSRDVTSHTFRLPFSCRRAARADEKRVSHMRNDISNASSFGLTFSAAK